MALAELDLLVKNLEKKKETLMCLEQQESVDERSPTTPGHGLRIRRADAYLAGTGMTTTFTTDRRGKKQSTTLRLSHHPGDSQGVHMDPHNRDRRQNQHRTLGPDTSRAHRTYGKRTG